MVAGSAGLSTDLLAAVGREARFGALATVPTARGWLGQHDPPGGPSDS